MADGASPIDTFIAYWSAAEASERANAQPFLIGLADLLDVPRPDNSHAGGYSFEFPVRIPTGPGTYSDGRIDLYRRGCFVLEAKQFFAPKAEQTDLDLVAIASGAAVAKKKTGPIRGSDAWDDAMIRARGQAERYARALPAEEPAPPFLLIVDVGHSIEVYADFTQAGKSYLPFPDPRTFRLRLEDLGDEKVRARLRGIWLEPLALDPSKVSAEVTREIAGYLAVLASSLEKAGHAPRIVAEFLTRCLFCMFAEDVGLLPKDSFRGLLESLRSSPEGFVPKLRQLFAEMQTGTDFSVILNKKLLRFNGGLFADASVLPVDGTQLGILIQAAGKQWKDVEPAIFGTLLERALNPEERHQLGAHYTPRAYVERLVLPTVVEPLRAEWDAIRAAALVHAQRGELAKARAEITGFHNRLCEVTVLDPACGSGNFLYVALEHLKRLEGEVLDVAAGFGENLLLDLATHSVDPHQFLGIELNPRAASLAELVLWIGYLQWHFRTRGQSLPAEPVLKKFRNIQCRDAVLAWDGDPQPARDEQGEVITVWDRRSQKTDFVTGRPVPDESKRLPLLTYPNARPAGWPKTDYVVGNPPFIGNKRMRDALGSGYTEALRTAYPSVPETADFVMYWWEKAATLTESDALRRFGFITTNSLRMIFNRGVVHSHLKKLSLIFAIPDHPWVDTAEGAAVRIAMTVGAAGELTGELRTVTVEEPLEDGSAKVAFAAIIGRIAADLKLSDSGQAAMALKANKGMAFTGMYPLGQGFVLLPEEVSAACGTDAEAATVVKPFVIARDLAQVSRKARVIDFYPFEQEDVRRRFPSLFQWVLTRVKPERDVNPVEERRRNWWLFTRPIPALRGAVSSLNRYIAVPRTAKWFTFQFVSAETRPDTSVVAIVTDDAWILGVLSSRIHLAWAVSMAGRLGVGNDTRYQHQETFNPFPFPAADEETKARIRSLGEELDAHRKRVQTQHPGLSLTAMYNVLEALRAGRALTAKEQIIHDQGLVSILRQLHDELDAAVAAAYGWPANLLDAEILTRLVALNAERAAEEADGQIRWLRPEYQAPKGATTQTGLAITTAAVATAKTKVGKTPWPKPLAERVQAVERALQLAAAPVTAAQLSKHFLRAKPEDLAEILETLATLGRAHRTGEKFSF
ncbi:MAG: DNA methyltransferase [Chthoniobacterales bacterium]